MPTYFRANAPIIAPKHRPALAAARDEALALLSALIDRYAVIRIS